MEDKLKELGYKSLTSAKDANLYDIHKWLREEKNRFIEVTLFSYGYDYRILSTLYVDYSSQHIANGVSDKRYDTFEDALEAGILKALDKVKEEMNLDKRKRINI